MASSQLLDLAVLVAAISEDRPTGIDIRNTSLGAPNSAAALFHRAKDIRSQARNAERNRIFEENSADSSYKYWQDINRLAQTLLQKHSKDLEVCTWLMEAQIRLHGFAGLRDTLTLLNQLIDTYWGDLFPLPDEDGIETTLMSLHGLNGDGKNGTLLAPLNTVALAPETSKGSFCYWQLCQARDVERMQDAEEKAIREKQLGIKWEDIQQIVALSPNQYYFDLRDDLTQSIAEFQLLDQKLTERCADDAPSTSAIRNLLGDILEAISGTAKDKFTQKTSVISVESSPSKRSEIIENTIDSNTFSSRQQALDKLKEVASFFRQTEPHSPISYAVEKAIRWGNLSLHELMSELIPDGGARDTFSLMTGVRFSSESSD